MKDDMEGSDERLARVTYLPGVKPPSESAVAPVPAVAPVAAVAPVPAAATVPVDRPVPTFAELRELADEREPVEPETEGERSARAENISMHALARRGVSSNEMRDLLAKRDLDESTIEFEVGRLERVGLLDDRELAENLVRQLTERKGLGRQAITSELRRRHIDAQYIDEALEASDTGSEVARATELAVKRAPQLRSLDATTAHRRLSAFLMRKGYSGSVVSAAVATALSPGRTVRFE
jgi:regulatory protein